MGKQRLDTLLVQKGLVESPEKARAMVMAGRVHVAERPVSKPGTLVDEAAALAITESARYVSRGGQKLEHALTSFRLDVQGCIAADFGSSTGGFTDCLLQHGAERVYAVDVGKGQLDYRLRQDPRVVVMEGVNARELAGLPEPVDLVTLDVSFISLRLVLPVAVRLLGDERRGAASAQTDVGRPSMIGGACCAPTYVRGIIALFKPQFEAEKAEVPRGGVIRDPQLHSRLIGRFTAWCVANNLRILDLASSPILGASGNRELLFWLAPAGARKPRLPRTKVAV